jgi:hypothetical protein
MASGSGLSGSLSTTASLTQSSAGSSHTLVPLAGTAAVNVHGLLQHDALTGELVGGLDGNPTHLLLSNGSTYLLAADTTPSTQQVQVQRLPPHSHVGDGGNPNALALQASPISQLLGSGGGWVADAPAAPPLTAGSAAAAAAAAAAASSSSASL